MRYSELGALSVVRVCLNLLCPAKEERLERSDINAPQGTEFHFVLTLKEF